MRRTCWIGLIPTRTHHDLAEFEPLCREGPFETLAATGGVYLDAHTWRPRAGASSSVPRWLKYARLFLQAQRPKISCSRCPSGSLK